MTRTSRLQPLARAVLRTQTDERLVALARDGKEAAFEEIVRRYRFGLVAFAAAYGPPDPEDVVQESLVRSWEALLESTGEMNLKPWLYTIVRNRALNARRDSRAHEPLSDQDHEPIDARQPADIMLTNEELDRAVAAVATLPDAQREALVRSALEGHTHEQIATSIGSTPGAVRQLIYRARIAVRHGVGLVIPLPVVAALAELGAGGAAAGAGAAAGGAAAAAGAAGGGSLATKAAIAGAVAAIAAGSGVAIERSGDADDSEGPPKVGNAENVGSPASTPAAAPAPAPAGSGGQVAANSGGSESERGESSDDRASGEEPSGSSGPGPGAPAGGDSSGPGPGTEPEPEPESDSDADSSGPGSTGSGSGSSGSGSSGSGSSGSGHSDGGSSGPGGGGGGPETDLPDPVIGESSGPGSGGSSGPSGGGSSGSGSSGSSGSGGGGSSGSGSGGTPELEPDDDD